MRSRLIVLLFTGLHPDKCGAPGAEEAFKSALLLAREHAGLG